MKAIPDTDLIDLTQQATDELIREARNSASNKIKQMFQKEQQLILDCSTLTTELEKKKTALAAHREKLTKLRAGDWTVLEEDKKQGEKPALPSIETKSERL